LQNLKYKVEESIIKEMAIGKMINKCETLVFKNKEQLNMFGDVVSVKSKYKNNLKSI